MRMPGASSSVVFSPGGWLGSPLRPRRSKRGAGGRSGRRRSHQTDAIRRSGHGTMRTMKKLILLVAAACLSCTSQAAVDNEIAAWEKRAQTITIVRDTWGIPHVYGKTDADAVFGVAYAQAEDDFNRVETNFINSIGRLAEAEGEKEIYRDLRMKLFIDPDDMKAQYQKSPEWLKALMNGWADGLNFYLHAHPKVTPRVIRHFEPWMALTFSEGSIGGDIERVTLRELEAFYAGGPKKETAPAYAAPPLRRNEP